MSEEFNYQSSLVNIGVTKVTVIVTNVSSDSDTQGPDHACKRVLIKAHPANTGIAWVNFGGAATDGGCYPLSANEVVAVPLTNTDEIHVLFKAGGEKVAVVYSN